jgi:hypothetical protein
MKETELRVQDKIEVGVEQEQKTEIKYITSKRKVPGLVLWSYNKKEQTLKPAEYIPVEPTVDYGKTRERLPKNIVLTEEGCMYFQALNRKNATKKLNKVGLQVK